MEAQREVALWPCRENYARFRAVCDDEIPATFDEFEEMATARLLELQKLHQITIDKLAFDPDQMAVWCRANFGKVNAQTRRMYAGFLALSH